VIGAPLDSRVMQEEVFGPILPIVEVNSVREVIDWVNDRPAPLAVYVFAEAADVAEQILQSTGSGDAGVNECTIHPILNDFPFGGLGTPAWAATTDAGDLRRSPILAGCCTTGPRSTLVSATRHTPRTSGRERS
jgi:hypothetical protein